MGAGGLALSLVTRQQKHHCTHCTLHPLAPGTSCSAAPLRLPRHTWVLCLPGRYFVHCQYTYRLPPTNEIALPTYLHIESVVLRTPGGTYTAWYICSASTWIWVPTWACSPPRMGSREHGNKAKVILPCRYLLYCSRYDTIYDVGSICLRLLFIHARYLSFQPAAPIFYIPPTLPVPIFVVCAAPHTDCF